MLTELLDLTTELSNLILILGCLLLAQTVGFYLLFFELMDEGFLLFILLSSLLFEMLNLLLEEGFLLVEL